MDEVDRSQNLEFGPVEASEQPKEADEPSRSIMEAEIRDIIGKQAVSVALLQQLSTAERAPGKCQLALNKVAGSRFKLGKRFVQGVQAMLAASGEKRLEVTWWMIHHLWEAGDVAELVEWMLREVGHVVQEADEEDAEAMKRIFGAGILDVFHDSVEGPASYRSNISGRWRMKL